MKRREKVGGGRDPCGVCGGSAGKRRSGLAKSDTENDKTILDSNVSVDFIGESNTVRTLKERLRSAKEVLERSSLQQLGSATAPA